MGHTVSIELTPEQKARQKILRHKYVECTHPIGDIISNSIFELDHALKYGTWEGYILPFDKFVDAIHEYSTNLFKMRDEMDEYSKLASWDSHIHHITEKLAIATFICAIYCDMREYTIETAIKYYGCNDLNHESGHPEIFKIVELCKSVDYLDMHLWKMLHILKKAGDAMGNHYFTTKIEDKTTTADTIDSSIIELLDYLNTVARLN